MNSKKQLKHTLLFSGLAVVTIVTGAVLAAYASGFLVVAGLGLMGVGLILLFIAFPSV